MPIPELSPSANDFTYSTTINVRLRPYFEIWFQRKRDDGETPEQFSLRMLKNAAMNDYYADKVKSEVDKIEADKQAAIEALQADIELMNTEVD